MLTDAECRNTKAGDKPRKLAEKGMYLFIAPNGSKLWRMDYVSPTGKRRTASFGSYPAVSLADARAQRAAIKEKLTAGVDPSAGEIAPQGPTFEAVARNWFKANESKWKTSYSSRIWRRIEQDMLPKIGAKPIAGITPQQVLEALRAIESRDAAYTARRIHQMTSLVFKWAVVEGHMKFNPAADLHVALKAVPKGDGRAALKESDLPEFFAKLAKYDGERQTALALKLAAHTFLRTNELRFAVWSEIDFDKAVWSVPAERMKMGRPHLVPLSRQSLDLLRQLQAIAGSAEWILPGVWPKKPISENTMLYGLYRLGYHSRATVHGFRATASTILNESELFDRDTIEIQLAHAPDDRIRAAYNRGDRWQRRVEMMQWYSDLLHRLEATGIERDLSDLLR